MRIQHPATTNLYVDKLAGLYAFHYLPFFIAPAPSYLSHTLSLALFPTSALSPFSI